MSTPKTTVDAILDSMLCEDCECLYESDKKEIVERAKQELKSLIKSKRQELMRHLLTNVYEEEIFNQAIEEIGQLFI